MEDIQTAENTKSKVVTKTYYLPFQEGKVGKKKIVYSIQEV